MELTGRTERTVTRRAVAHSADSAVKSRRVAERESEHQHENESRDLAEWWYIGSAPSPAFSCCFHTCSKYSLTELLCSVSK